MKKEFPDRIIKLLAARMNGTIAKEEEVELSEWRAATRENEELFRRLIQGDGLKVYLQMYAEHDYRAKFISFERRIKGGRQRVLARRFAYVAVVVPFVFMFFMLWNDEFSSEKEIGTSGITHGSAKALLTFGDGHTVCLEDWKSQGKLDSNIMVDRDTLRYSKIDSASVVDVHTLSIPRGGEFSVTLADGTKVWLNSESEFRYPSDFCEAERRVFLKGEAYFEVKHDAERPFVVVSGEQAVRVLGTSFAVRAYPGEKAILTTLESGSVYVQAKMENVILKPGEQSVTGGDSIEVKKVNTLMYTAWKDGKFVFKDESLNTIMSTLSRWYDVDVFYTSPDLGEIQFTGELIRYSDIEELLQKFEVLEKVKFNVKNKTIIVNKY